MDVEDLLSCAQVSRLFKKVAMSDCIWRSMCVHHKCGGSLDFAERLGCSLQPDAQPLRRADDLTTLAHSTLGS